MKTLTIKMLDNFDALKVGHIYELVTPGAARLITFCDVTEGAMVNMISLYPYQVQQARLSGKMVDHDDTQSAQMQSSIASSICAHLPTKFIY